MSNNNRPNIVVFFTDQQRWDSCNCYGNPMADLTPVLDSVAAEGVRFEHAFSPQPVCGPARACLQTGRYATEAGVWKNGLTLDPQVPTLASQFRQAGYDTCYIGKWHLSATYHEPVPEPLRGGFDDWFACDGLEHTTMPYHGVIYDKHNTPVDLRGYRVDALTDIAIEQLRRKREHPLMLWISHLEPHHQNNMRRFYAPDGYARRYREDCYVPPDLIGRDGDWQTQLPDYYGCVKSLDENLGRVVAELDALGIRDNTLLVFISDHGCHFYTRPGEYKRSCHEASIRVPMVLQGPGFQHGAACSALASLLDIPTTLLAAAGIKPPQGMRGRDLHEALNRDGTDWRDEVYVQISEEKIARALRTERWKYCVEAMGVRGDSAPWSETYTESEMYDLQADPHERDNRIADPTLDDVRNDLRSRLLARLREAGEPPADIRAASDCSDD